MIDTLSVTSDGQRGGRSAGFGRPPLTIHDIQARDSVRGLERLSLCDWPGRMSAVLFFGGCNLRCPTCHNAELAWTAFEIGTWSQPGWPKGAASPLSRLVATRVSRALSWRKSLVRPSRVNRRSSRV